VAAPRPYRYVTVDVFTDRQFGGNPLAVLLDARGLSDAEMLAVTREFNYAETTFVLPPERGGAARVRIFTPGGEVPFAGHPTVGTAHALFATGALAAEGDEATIVLEEGVGDVPVRVRLAGGAGALGEGFGAPEPAFAELTAAAAPTERDAPDAGVLAGALSLDPADLLGGDYAPRVASCGLPFTLVPVRTRAAVARARVRPELWERAYAGPAWGRGVSEGAMVFTTDAPRVSTSRPRVRARPRRARRPGHGLRRGRPRRLPRATHAAAGRHARVGGGAGRRDGAAEPAARLGGQAGRGDRGRARRRPGRGGVRGHHVRPRRARGDA
jgi:PhzF family phenazine biosynthesis protein